MAALKVALNNALLKKLLASTLSMAAARDLVASSGDAGVSHPSRAAQAFRRLASCPCHTAVVASVVVVARMRRTLAATGAALVAVLRLAPLRFHLKKKFHIDNKRGAGALIAMNHFRLIVLQLYIK
eukprot:GHVT01079890.1.p1 GENE.GHVT01079890.1~~GHVT01079890.1.p1  ORF type:complete len:126 (+),score=17.06 GHVT01079890.1:371-748(+)